MSSIGKDLRKILGDKQVLDLPEDVSAYANDATFYIAKKNIKNLFLSAVQPYGLSMACHAYPKILILICLKRFIAKLIWRF